MHLIFCERTVLHCTWGIAVSMRRSKVIYTLGLLFLCNSLKSTVWDFKACASTFALCVLFLQLCQLLGVISYGHVVCFGVIVYHFDLCFFYLL